ncbi:MAG: tetratricopeptide repeat protein [Clostridia bacterium]|nr:tetratricopeptide repeat protein [Clostridia bacterium]
MDENLEEIERIVNESELKSAFAIHGLPALRELQAGNMRQVIGHLKSLFKEDKAFNNPKLALVYGECLSATGAYDEALKAFGYYADLYPENPDIHQKLSQVHRAMNQEHEAILEETIYEMLC